MRKNKRKILLALILALSMALGNMVYALDSYDNITKRTERIEEGNRSDEHSLDENDSQDVLNEELWQEKDDDTEEDAQLEVEEPDTKDLMQERNPDLDLEPKVSLTQILLLEETIDLSNLQSGTGYTYSNTLVTINESGTYNIIDSGSQPTTSVRIAIAAKATDVVLVLNDITINQTTASPITLNAGSEVTLLLSDDTENTLTVTSVTYAGISVHETAELTINVPVEASGNGKLNITAWIDEIAGAGGAGIGGNAGMNSGKINISGGNVTSSSNRGAGIGGGGYGANLYGGGSGSDITITGGMVNATSVRGAGIGGGDGSFSVEGGNGGNITITGEAKVTAKAGLGDGGYAGAAIGGGGGSGSNAGNGGNITISGNAKVEASGGIGGGESSRLNGGDGGTIIIKENAMVESTAIRCAGIGGGGVHSGTDSIGGSGGFITIEGNAKVTVQSEHGAGIGGGSAYIGGSGGEIVINTSESGFVKATSTGGAGIGGGNTLITNADSSGGDGGTIEIKGDSIVEALSEKSAGIGGGGSGAATSTSATHGGDGGNITISENAKVLAKSDVGAGIGGGYSINGQGGDGGNVTITGGTVTAIGGSSLSGLATGAGIGGGGKEHQTNYGNGGDGGTVLITGGIVTASAHRGAGIGGGGGYNTGQSGSGGEITISGGTVTATSKEGAGMGGAYGTSGNGGDGGTVNIEGNAKVIAVGGEYSSGIGGAYGTNKTSTDGSHILDDSFGSGAKISIDAMAEVEAYSKYGHAIHADNEEISGEAYIINAYLWDGDDMNPFHDSDDFRILGFSEDMDDFVDIMVPAEFTSFAFTGNEGPYLLYTDEEIPRTIVYHEDTEKAGDVYLLSSNVDGTAEPVTYGVPFAYYSVTYDANNGTGTVPVDDTQYLYGKTVVVKDNIDLEREGYEFKGWTTIINEAETIYKNGDLYTITGDVTFYAFWIESGSEVDPPIPPIPPTPPTTGGNGGGRTGSIVKDEKPSEKWDPPNLFTSDHFAYMFGYPDGTVRPENRITRAEVAAILYRLLDDNYRTSVYSLTNPYGDVINGQWYSVSVTTMTNAGVLDGYPDGTFKPGNTITRGEFAKVIAMFLGGSYTGENKFSDINGHWAAPYINLAAQNDWIAGYPEGAYKPDSFITRGEAAAILNRILERNPDNEEDLLEGMILWPDNQNKGKWYYLDIQEATNGHTYERKEPDLIYEKWVELNN